MRRQLAAAKFMAKKKTARLKMDHLICSRSAASLCGGKSVLGVVLGIGPCGPVRRIFGPIQRPPLPRVLCFAPRHGVQAGDDSDGAEQAAMKRTLYLLSKLSGADSIFLITKHKKKMLWGVCCSEKETCLPMCSSSCRMTAESAVVSS